MKVFPVIHIASKELALDNALKCSLAGTDGVFLIDMDHELTSAQLVGLAGFIKKTIQVDNPNFKVGINDLKKSAYLTVKNALEHQLDMAWSDKPIVTGLGCSQEALLIKQVIDGHNATLSDNSSPFAFFNSIAFKYQAVEADPELAALNSYELGFIPTTSGVATGVGADFQKLKTIRANPGVKQLALASGLTPNNIVEYSQYITHALVATGISHDFYTIDTDLLATFIANSR